MTEKRHYCCYCGEDMGPWDKFCSKDDTCGKQECERYMRDRYAAEREEAHEQLDRDRGWE